MKVLTVIGARPQFVKAAVVSRAFKGSVVDEVLVHTGQHFDANMSEVFFSELGIPAPRHHLGLHSLPHGAMTGRMMEGLEALMKAESPDQVMVYGDTDSTLAGALAAAKLHIPVVHVEAGLRSFDMKMPEEVNRVLTDRVSRLLLCPTKKAVSNLEAEGYSKLGVRIVQVGDVMFDSVEYERKRLKGRPRPTLCPEGAFSLLTLHRAENTDEPERFDGIIEGLNAIAQEQTILWPVHPRTKKLLEGRKLAPQIRLVSPLGYLDMLQALELCQSVITDSGGLQKEAYFFKKPCLTLRDQTEWVELVEAGANVLTGANSQKILAGFKSLKSIGASSWPTDLYGDGHAGVKIVNEILKEATHAARA
jgi:UDP-GlcNAc3NAcA epimerase